MKTAVRLLSVHKYPQYSVDLYLRFIGPWLWRRQGITLGSRIHWYGSPIITLAPGSTISIGSGCAICSRSTQTALGVNHPVILRTLHPGARLLIGAGVRMSGTTICAAEEVTIGDRCVIGANVTIADTDFHSLDPIVRSSDDDARSAAHHPVHVGSDVFIGAGSMILKGVTVGAGAVIGAGSIVTGDVPAGTVVVGNPARQISPKPGEKDRA